MVIVGLARVRGARDHRRDPGSHDRVDKPVCVVWPSPPSGVIAEFARHGISAFLDPARGMRALRRLVEHHALRVPPGTCRRRRGSFVRLAPSACPSADPMPSLRRIAVTPFFRPRACRWRRGSWPGRKAKPSPPPTELGFPGRAEGDQPGGDASRRRRAGGGRSAVGRRKWRSAFAGCRARARACGGAGRHLRAEDDQGRNGAPGRRLPRSDVRDDDFLRRRRRADRARRRRGHAARAGRRSGCRGHDRAVCAVIAICARGRTMRATRPAAAFVAAFSRLAASAPWTRFRSRSIPSNGHADGAVAVDGLLLIEQE